MMCDFKQCYVTSSFSYSACMCDKSLQSCMTLCNPMDHSSPGSSFHGILQTRILGWIAMPPPGDLPNPGIEPTCSGRRFLYHQCCLGGPSHILGSYLCLLLSYEMDSQIDILFMETFKSLHQPGGLPFMGSHRVGHD